ncbi:thioesterase family protein [Corallococcus exiguus]|uniref:thioesterase family protein n=1 Tax=Corallococcus exiguus TaxID=83462 RepID=UPI0014719181|nr:thioesterase family protein [Corallococcus exiguus]NNB89334.1 thioesterase family protein [Corallococcus exiguus]
MHESHATLEVGLRHREQLHVEDRHTVPRFNPDWPGFSDMPPVLATAMLVGFIEHTCVLGLRSLLTAEQRTVGTHVDISQVAPTPTGRTVTAAVEWVSIDGKSLLFKVTCHDDAGLVSEGTHRRAIIDMARFCKCLKA